MLNRIIIQGRLTRDPEKRHTQNDMLHMFRFTGKVMG